MKAIKQLRYLAFLCAALLLVAGPAAPAHAKKAAAKGKVVRLKIENMDKTTPIKKLRKLEKAVRAVKGITYASAARKKSVLIIRQKPTVNMDAVKKAVVAAGFTLAAETDSTDSATAAEDEGAPTRDDETKEMDEPEEQ